MALEQALQRGNFGDSVVSSPLHQRSIQTAEVYSHPLEESEEKYAKFQDEFHFQTLRSVQGLHAPLRLQAERIAASKIGRLPCLQSSHLMMDILTGRVEMIDFTDFLNPPELSEHVISPHAHVEQCYRFT